MNTEYQEFEKLEGHTALVEPEELPEDSAKVSRAPEEIVIVPVLFHTGLERILENQTITSWRASGTHPAHVYAFDKTGIVVLKENFESTSPQDLKTWEDAMNEYFAEHPGDRQ